MKIRIDRTRTTGEIQKEFNTAYPYLKLVFFSKPHKAYKGSPAKFLITKPDMLLRDLEQSPRDGFLYLEDDMPTWQIERLFEEEYGLHVQLFRKSGNTWLETSVSDDLTLEEQNAKGKANEQQNFEFVDPLDYREQD